MGDQVSEQRSLLEADLERVQAGAPTSVGELCVLHLALYFARQYAACRKPDKVPEYLDETARACLFACAESPPPFSFALLGALRAAVDGLQTFALYRGLDALPFVLCEEILWGNTKPIAFPPRHFTNGDSSVRLYAFDLAWIARRWLAPERCVPGLLRNVENTLGYWFESLALCRHLFADENAFWQEVDRYEPEEMPDQYRSRVAWARENRSNLKGPAYFLDQDARRARTIARLCFPLPVRFGRREPDRPYARSAQGQ